VSLSRAYITQGEKKRSVSLKETGKTSPSSLFRLLLDLRRHRWQPARRMLVEERPRWHHGKERHRRARETNVNGVFEIPQDEADDPGYNLSWRVSR
jgi:hypothetical protein